MKYLLIGGAGYIGTSLADLLVKEENDVTVFDTFLVNNPSNSYKAINFIIDNIRNCRNYKSRILEVDHIFYLASPRLENKITEEEIEKELENLKYLLDLLEKNNFTGAFYFISSCSVYGYSNKDVNESSTTQITSKYSELKIKSEQLILNRENNNFFILRLPTIIGPNRVTRFDTTFNQLFYEAVKNKEITIYGIEEVRPYLDIDDCTTILSNITHSTLNYKIFNIGTREINYTKREIIQALIKSLSIPIKVNLVDKVTDRNYNVDFTLCENVVRIDCTTLEETINKLKLNYEKKKIICSTEDWDNILEYYLPNGASKNWYYKDEGSLYIPHNWGAWNMYDWDNDNKNFNNYTIRKQIFPFSDNLTYYTKNELQDQPHLYIINVLNSLYFQKNSNTGLKTISERFLDDIRSGLSKLIFFYPFEGYSGQEYNMDLETIQKWIDEYNLPPENVFLFSGNLKIQKIIQEKGFRYKGIGVDCFDSWIPIRKLVPRFIANSPIEFNPKDEKFLFLSYNRTARLHRLYLLNELYGKGLFYEGKVSIKYEEYLKPKTAQELDIFSNIFELGDQRISDDLKNNHANDINVKDFESTFLSLVSETLVDPLSLFVSEKTYKPLAIGHPFLILGNPGILQYLKDQGFQTYSNWFDESYDFEKDFNKRIVKIVDNIDRYRKYSLEDLQLIRNEMKEVGSYNVKKFYERLNQKYTIWKNSYITENFSFIENEFLQIYKDLLN